MSEVLIIVQVLGGIGLFLLGMIVMTEGLRTLAGGTMRSVLMRFTKSPITGALTGAVSTAILQSSSLTTVAAVGFVGAELITFPDALGIVFGANIGTTFKGWIIALLGFKFSLENVFLPLVFLGAILKLFTKGRLSTIGYSIAGFGLIFVGITYMQSSMSEMQSFISFEDLPADSLTSRLLLVLIGVVFTAITQSSSAGVVAALTALYAGLINFNQAAALVIGMDVGTTMTAALSTVGGSVGAKRTGFSHVVYNLLTATGALVVLTPYTRIWEYLSPGALVENAEIALVGFHTFFNTLGVIIILPFTKQFARFMEWLIPGKPSPYIEKLDDALLEDTDLALNAVQSVIKNESIALFRHINAILGDTETGKRVDLDELQSALNKTHAFVDRIQIKPEEGVKWERFVNIVHTLDHLQRLHERCEEDEDRAVTARDTAELSEECSLLTRTIKEIIQDIGDNSWHHSSEIADEAAKTIHKKVRPYRAEVMSRVASGELSVNRGTSNLEAIRWLRRVSRHVTRITQHTEASLLAVARSEDEQI
ncbi:MAG: Na/Pi symporter [Thermodesulfobacteriota bacterium]